MSEKSRKGRRLIPRDACSWCGHRHDAECVEKIRVQGKPEKYAPCPCAKRVAA